MNVGWFSSEYIYRLVTAAAEWCPQGQVPAGPCGQMFTEIVGTNLSTHIPTHHTSTPRGSFVPGPHWISNSEG